MSEHALGHPETLDSHKATVERQELIASLDRFLVKHYGDRCDTVQGGCPCCAVWASRDALNASIFE